MSCIFWNDRLVTFSEFCVCVHDHFSIYLTLACSFASQEKQKNKKGKGDICMALKVEHATSASSTMQKCGIEAQT